MTHEDSFGIEHFFDRNDILPFPWRVKSRWFPLARE